MRNLKDIEAAMRHEGSLAVNLDPFNRPWIQVMRDLHTEIEMIPAHEQQTRVTILFGVLHEVVAKRLWQLEADINTMTDGTGVAELDRLRARVRALEKDLMTGIDCFNSLTTRYSELMVSSQKDRDAYNDLRWTAASMRHILSWLRYHHSGHFTAGTREDIDVALKLIPEEKSVELEVDEERVNQGTVAHTGIFIRARRGITFGSYDIAELTRASLLAWLRSRGGRNEWAEQTVLALLGHRLETKDG